MTMFVVTAEEMRELDRTTIEEIGIPGAVLMENAGRAAVSILWCAFPDLASLRVAVLCGRGNNGGDGFVMARCLMQQGVQTDTYLVGRRGRVAGDARIPLEVLDRLGIPIYEIETDGGRTPQDIPWDRYDLFIDALLGTGLGSEVKGVLGELILSMNRSRALVMAVDIPSGLSSDHGRPLGVAVQARLTVTFGLPKVGQFLYPGRTLCGDLWVADIGIPSQAVEGKPPIARVITPEDLAGMIPSRTPEAHKGHYGHLLVIAGSAGKTGAGVMASEAALRVGAGLVTLGIPASLNLAMEARLTEVMTLPLPEDSGQVFSSKALDEILSASDGKACMALGPGISTLGQIPEVVRGLVRRADLPMVIDADGLNALVGHLDLVRTLAAPRILTPHPGEMARLLGRSVAEVQEDRIGSALALARHSGAYVVLKGAGTVVAAPEGQVGLVPTGNPAMASAGMGDVLTGILGGLLAQGMDPMRTASLGTYLHGWVADRWAEGVGGRGLMATDLLGKIPAALEEILQGRVVGTWPKRLEGWPFHA
jgi:hydroxyethylthiazole kinase-like uncharacterized protein yjeF